jgi:hypothetical protein
MHRAPSSSTDVDGIAIVIVATTAIVIVATTAIVITTSIGGFEPPAGPGQYPLLPVGMLR